MDRNHTEHKRVINQIIPSHHMKMYIRGVLIFLHSGGSNMYIYTEKNKPDIKPYFLILDIVRIC